MKTIFHGAHVTRAPYERPDGSTVVSPAWTDESRPLPQRDATWRAEILLDDGSVVTVVRAACARDPERCADWAYATMKLHPAGRTVHRWELSAPGYRRSSRP